MSKTAELETPETAAPVIPLKPGAVTFLEARNNAWSAVVPRGTTKERLLQSGFWSVAGDRFRAYDIIHVIDEGRAYFAQLLVVASGRGYVHLEVLNWLPLEAHLTLEAGSLPPGFEIEWRGPDLDARYCALRVADSVTIVKGKATREECLAALLEHGSLQ